MVGWLDDVDEKLILIKDFGHVWYAFEMRVNLVSHPVLDLFPICHAYV